jgi:hypothetical protein
MSVSPAAYILWRATLTAFGIPKLDSKEGTHLRWLSGLDWDVSFPEIAEKSASDGDMVVYGRLVITLLVQVGFELLDQRIGSCSGWPLPLNQFQQQLDSRSERISPAIEMLW